FDFTPERRRTPSPPAPLDPPTFSPQPGQPNPELEASPPRLRASKTLHRGLTAIPCDELGNDLPPGTLPPPRITSTENDWSPYANETQFRIAEFLYRRVQMSAANIDYLFETWALSMQPYDDTSPFASHEDMYRTIDSTSFGDSPWQSFTISYDGEVPPDAATWKSVPYEIYYRDPDVVISHMLENPDFHNQFDYVPYIRRDKNGQRT
ncbi:hypothetical protein H0H92_015441, partial [Tricholoma furcatifolium]